MSHSTGSEVNKEQAEACATRGQASLRAGDFDTAARLLAKAQRLHDLGPGVRAQLAEAQARATGGGGGGDSPSPGGSSPMSSPEPKKTPAGASGLGGKAAGGGGVSGGSGTAAGGGASSTPDLRHRGGVGGTSTPTPSATPGSAASSAGEARRASAAAAAAAVANARPYTAEQAALVKRLRATKDFYGLLGVARDADEKQISTAYKKVALKIHPDKNSAPGAEEVFKRLANSQTVLLDPQARAHHDRPRGGRD